MRQKKKNNNFYEKDNALLLEYMDKVIAGDFSEIDVSAFHNKEAAEKFNAVLASFLKTNNNFVMRLNDSMTRIGDSSCVKEMIEQVNSQTTAINDMRGSSQDLGDSIQNIQNSVQNIQENSHNVINTTHSCIDDMNMSIRIVDESSKQISEINNQISDFKEKAIKINEIIDMVKKIAQKSGLLALNASIEAARAGEAGKGFAVVANQIKEMSASTTASAENVVKNVEELIDGISSLSESINATTTKLNEGNESVHKSVQEMDIINEQLNSMSKEIDSIYEEINTQSALTQSFVASIDSIGDSYETLSEECVGTGAHLYRISRDIDKARSDMARKNSKLSTLDWMTVFEVDHLIFTWRVYNNLADFEKLKIEQLNNPKGCKLGKWMDAQTDPRIKDSKEFKQVVKDHEDIHKYSCDSWYAKDKGDREEALRQFNLAYDAYNRFIKSITLLREVVKATGDSEVTEI
ncbi:MAG: methyl-accepting chemotaxis protein [Lachnospiraceae bacterium]|nr:methyl-accepting chemotaxis protein [Lachnospiraceae bacterium]